MFEFQRAAAQGLLSHHYWIIDSQLETFSAPFRYLWPAELDLMARLAEMSLRERWCTFGASLSPVTAPRTSSGS